MRIGMGHDVHRLTEGRPLILGGVDIPFEKGLLGHSDADVLVHAVCDALLGAAGLGDIGTHFPDTDDRYRGISSLELLRRVMVMLKEQGLSVANVDATVFAEAPRIGPHRAKMAARLAEILEISPDQVNIKATTAEGLGVIGAGEGIAAMSVALLTGHPLRPVSPVNILS